MGADQSHMNLYALKSVVQSDNFMVENLLRRVEGRELRLKALPRSRLKRVLIPKVAKKKDGLEGEEEGSSSSSTAESKSSQKAAKPLKKKLGNHHDDDYDDVEGDKEGNPDEVEIDGVTYLVRYEFLKDGEAASAAPVAAADEQQYNFPDDQYHVRVADFKELLRVAAVHPSDESVLLELFCLRDKRGYDTADVREVLICFCLLTSTSVIECLAFAFSLFDRNNLFVISKDELAKVFLTLNEGCFFYGDRPVPSPMVTDLANSIFTNAGKIDGDLCYRDYYDFILEHPIIEMYISAQFQGPVQDKMMDEIDLNKNVLSIRF